MPPPPFALFKIFAIINPWTNTNFTKPKNSPNTKLCVSVAVPVAGLKMATLASILNLLQMVKVFAKSTGTALVYAGHFRERNSAVFLSAIYSLRPGRVARSAPTRKLGHKPLFQNYY